MYKVWSPDSSGSVHKRISPFKRAYFGKKETLWNNSTECCLKNKFLGRELNSYIRMGR